MKKILCLFLCACFIFLFSSCSERGAEKNISYPLNNSPVTLDPQFAADTAAQVVINNTFEGLVRLDENGEIIPGIAESWSVSPDNLTYTFKLKSDTEWYCPGTLKKEFGDEFYEKFSSEKVTANDFVFACRRAVTLREGSTHAHRLFPIENASEVFAGTLSADKLGVTAPDDNTLVIKLETECPDFLSRLTECEFMPCNEVFFNRMGGRYGLSAKHILCNGPFYVSAWDTEASLTIKANKYYAGEQKVLPNSVVFTFDPDPASVAKKLSSASYTAALLSPDYPQPEETQTVFESKNATFGYCFNCADKYLSNFNLRMALCLVIDRNLYLPVEGMAVPQSGFIPENCVAGSVPYRAAAAGQTPHVEYDGAQAAVHWKTALEELELKKLSLTVLCPEWMEAAVRKQLQGWQKYLGIGLGVTVEVKEPDEIRSAVESGNYQIALTDVISEYDNAVDFIASFNDGGIFRFNGAEYNAITEKLLMTDSEDQLLGGCFTAETYILQQGICYPLYSRESRFVISSDAADIFFGGSENKVCFISAKRYD